MRDFLKLIFRGLAISVGLLVVGGSIALIADWVSSDRRGQQLSPAGSEIFTEMDGVYLSEARAKVALGARQLVDFESDFINKSYMLEVFKEYCLAKNLAKPACVERIDQYGKTKIKLSDERVRLMEAKESAETREKLQKEKALGY
jgi:hypothetical protein